ncbi:MAG: hypothetical protein II738_04595 [Clostridia bacterium]|nr:hypothetical protein [Clostridia bacterium]
MATNGPQWNYDYSKTLWMKMFLAAPDFTTMRSQVRITFAQALQLIKQVDAITQGVLKIVYLVGWQGLGHDDCYPEMDVVNDALKRPEDPTARDSLWWLFREAKRYHTVVSFHVNVSDAYTATPCFRELAAANAVVNNSDGVPTPIEVFNGRDGYKTSYKQFWESGIFKRLFDRFCEVTPVQEAGTVHLDNFCIAENLNPRTAVEEQDAARNKMLDYIASLGVDVTSENTYREAPLRAERPGHPIRKLYAQSGEELPEVDWRTVPIRTLGRIPATWWTTWVSMEECIRIPPSVYGGHLTERAQMNVFYGSMHGEDIWLKYGNDPKDWGPAFIAEFCTYHVPYTYLNRYERLRYETDETAPEDGRYTVYFSDGVVSRGKDRSIAKNGVVLKRGNDVILPLTEDNQTFIAYSESGRSGLWNVPDAAFTEADVCEITPGGNRFLCRKRVTDGQVELTLAAGQAVAIKAAESQNR